MIRAQQNVGLHVARNLVNTDSATSRHCRPMTEIPNMTSAIEFGTERPRSMSFWRRKRDPRNRHAKSARVRDTLDLDDEIKQRIEENELAGERLVNHIRLTVAILGGVIVALVWGAQSPIARWGFATLVAGYAVFWAVMALLLRQPRYRPRLKYVATTFDLVWLFGLTFASLFNYSGVYETYRAPISWLLIAVFNALTALRLNPRLSLFAGCLTLVLGFTELVLDLPLHRRPVVVRVDLRRAGPLFG